MPPSRNTRSAPPPARARSSPRTAAGRNAPPRRGYQSLVLPLDEGIRHELVCMARVQHTPQRHRVLALGGHRLRGDLQESRISQLRDRLVVSADDRGLGADEQLDRVALTSELRKPLAY